MGRPPQCDACCPVTTSTTTTTLFPPTTPPPPPPPPPPECPDGFFQCRYEYSNGSWASVWEANRNPNCECTCPSTSSVQGDWFSQNSEDPVDGQCADVIVPCCSPDCYSYAISFNDVCFGTTTTTEGPTTATTTTLDPASTTTTTLAPPDPHYVIFCTEACDEDKQISCFGEIYPKPYTFNPTSCQDFSNQDDALAFYTDMRIDHVAAWGKGDCNSDSANYWGDVICRNCPDQPCTTTTTATPTTTTTTSSPTTTTTTTENPLNTTTTTTGSPTTTTTADPSLATTTTTTAGPRLGCCLSCSPVCDSMQTDVPEEDCDGLWDAACFITRLIPPCCSQGYTECCDTPDPDPDPNDPGDNPDEDANPTPV